MIGKYQCKSYSPCLRRACWIKDILLQIKVMLPRNSFSLWAGPFAFRINPKALNHSLIEWLAIKSLGIVNFGIFALHAVHSCFPCRQCWTIKLLKVWVRWWYYAYNQCIAGLPYEILTEFMCICSEDKLKSKAGNKLNWWDSDKII